MKSKPEKLCHLVEEAHCYLFNITLFRGALRTVPVKCKGFSTTLLPCGTEQHSGDTHEG